MEPSDETTTTPVSSLAAWRQERRQRLMLPSGLPVVVQKVAILDLAARGQVPVPLIGQVQTFINESEGGIGVDVAQFHTWAPVIDLIVAAALLDPPIADVPDDDHIALAELPIGDKLVIFNWAQREGAALIPFPG